MVVSGLSHCTGPDHVTQILEFALHQLRVARHFRIRHLPQCKLLLRIGIHLGPCAAGMTLTDTDIGTVV
jgi:class 3 adenylate cyclase